MKNYRVLGLIWGMTLLLAFFGYSRAATDWSAYDRTGKSNLSLATVEQVETDSQELEAAIEEEREQATSLEEELEALQTTVDQEQTATASDSRRLTADREAVEEMIETLWRSQGDTRSSDKARDREFLEKTFETTTWMYIEESTDKLTIQQGHSKGKTYYAFRIGPTFYVLQFDSASSTFEKALLYDDADLSFKEEVLVE